MFGYQLCKWLCRTNKNIYKIKETRQQQIPYFPFPVNLKLKLSYAIGTVDIDKGTNKLFSFWGFSYFG